MSSRHGCVVSVITRAGIPITSMPEGKTMNIFSMLVYSLAELSHGKTMEELRYDLNGKELVIYVGRKTMIAVLVSSPSQAPVSKFARHAWRIIGKLDEIIVEEGIVDGGAVEEAKRLLIEAVRESGLPVDGVSMAFRKVCGNIYSMLLRRRKMSGFGGFFRIAFFPRVTSKVAVESERDITVRRILRLCDGEHSIRYICESLHISESYVYRVLGALSRAGVVEIEMGFELVE